MASFPRTCLLIFSVYVLLESGCGVPTPNDDAEQFRVQLEQSIFSTFDLIPQSVAHSSFHGHVIMIVHGRGLYVQRTVEFAQFLRSYFTIQTQMRNESREQPAIEPGPDTAHPAIRRRRASLPLRFEDVERQYLIKQSLQLLGEFVGYVEYVQNDNETRSYLEDILREHGDMLKTMSVSQLKSYLGTLQRTMEDGVNSQHQMVVNGKVYSLDHISSWCCQFG